MNAPLQLLLYFVLYAFLGWCAEVAFAAVTTRQLVNRGFLNGPQCPIYGFGMVALLVVLGPWRQNLPAVFFGSMVLATLVELVGGWLLYRLFHTRMGGLIALVAGTVAMGLVMMVANHFITPFYMGAPTEAVDAMLVTVILPFNLLKAGINSVITFLVYKTVSRTLIHGEGWERTSSPKAGSEA